MRKPAFSICENKGATDQRLCFSYIDSTIPLLPKSKISSVYPSSLSVLDLVGNPNDRFSCDAAQIVLRFFICEFQYTII